MGVWTYGVDIATMLTGLSAVTAASVWTTDRVRAWRQHAGLKKARIWNVGYIPMDRFQFWFVKLADDDKQDPMGGRVILEVLRTEGGECDSQMAWSLRNQVKRGSLAMPPTPEQEVFLRNLQRARRARPGAFPVT
jgi:hypothetical protein